MFYSDNMQLSDIIKLLKWLITTVMKINYTFFWWLGRRQSVACNVVVVVVDREGKNDRLETIETNTKCDVKFIKYSLLNFFLNSSTLIYNYTYWLTCCKLNFTLLSLLLTFRFAGCRDTQRLSLSPSVVLNSCVLYHFC